MRNVKAVTLLLFLSMVVSLGWSQGGNPPASTKASGQTSGRGETAVEQTVKGTKEKKVVEVDSSKAAFKEVRPGVSKVILWGDDTKGPYGAFTKFTPGLTNPLHTHTNDIRIVVLKGAYIYKPEKGEERRIGPGRYLSVPGGDRHVSSGDPKEGALFYEESPGRFDLKLVEQAPKK